MQAYLLIHIAIISYFYYYTYHFNEYQVSITFIQFTFMSTCFAFIYYRRNSSKIEDTSLSSIVISNKKTQWRILEFNTLFNDYSMIVATTPAPTVRPPSRIANLVPSSIAIGAIKFNSHFNVIARHNHFCLLEWIIPVTSVVRK